MINTYLPAANTCQRLIGLLLLIMASIPAAFGGAPTTPATVADALHAALLAADEASVRSLLAEDVLIFESGGVERSLEEYASHHMHADMAFTKGTERELLERTERSSGDLAVVNSRSRMSGTFRDQPVDLDSNETLVLSRASGEWKIVHIHWSSRKR